MLYKKIGKALLLLSTFIFTILFAWSISHIFLDKDPAAYRVLGVWDRVTFAALDLNPGDDVLWWVDVSGLEGEMNLRDGRDIVGTFNIGDQIVSDIDYMLNHSDGWSSAGINFTHTQNKNDAQIVILPMNSNEDIDDFCRISGNEACVNNPYGLLQRGNKCAAAIKYHLYPGFTLPDDFYNNTYLPAFLTTVNHEIGHCLLGAGHSHFPEDLMYHNPDEYGDMSKVRFPHHREIDELKKRIEN